MDPVNPKALKGKFKDREDKDIDNDGDVDSSDEYLHKRRSAVSKAISKVKEAVELDEDIKGFAKKMIAKASNSDKWHDLMRSKYGEAKWDSYWKSNKNKDFWDKILDTGFNEAVELDELSAVTLGKYSQKARTDALDHSGGPWGKKKDPARVEKRLKGDAMAVKKLDKIRKEEVELNEISKKTLVNYMDKSKKQTADIQKKFKKGTETKDDEKTFDKRVSGQIKALDKFHGRSKVPASGVDKPYDAAQKAMKKEEVELDEAKLSTQQRDRLDDLILNVHMTTHPEYDGEETPGKYLKDIEKEFGANVAKQVKDGMEITHWGRDNRSSGNDKLSWRKGGARITKSGKMNKQDVEALKNRIKRDKAWGGITKKVKLPEESVVAKVLDRMSEAKGGYTINHKTFSSAVQHAEEVVNKRGFEVDPEEWDRKVSMGPRKPGAGKTNSYTIALMKNGKEVKQKLQMQVYYDEGRYELNMYIS